jgi:hypothetical protein
VIFYDLYRPRANPVAEDDDICAIPPRIRHDNAGMIEKVGNLGDVLSARIFARAFLVGELSKEGHIHPERRQLRPVREIEDTFLVDLQLVQSIMHA